MVLAAFSNCTLQHNYHAVASTVYVLEIKIKTGSAQRITVCVCTQQSQLGVATLCMQLSRSVF